MKSNKLIISIHIPRTGGSSFRDYLKKLYKNEFFTDYLGRENDDIQFSLQPLSFKNIFDIEYWALRKKYAPLRKNIKCIHGHIRVSKYIDTFPDADYITWLRDPVQRVISSYRGQFRCKRATILTEQVSKFNLSLTNFARMPLIHNNQYKFIYPLNPKDLKFIGINEYHEKSMKLFKKIFNIKKNINFPKVNVNPKRKGKKYKVSKIQEKKILKYNQLDQKIYQKGLKIFKNLCKKYSIK